MQLEKAKKLRKHWAIRNVIIPLSKRIFLDSDTGDKVCITFGRVVNDEDLFELHKNWCLGNYYADL